MKDVKRDLSCFSNISRELVAKNAASWKETYYSQYFSPRYDYSLEEIERIINSGEAISQQYLSRYFYDRNAIYRRILMYYASLLTYSGLLIPHIRTNSKLSTQNILKKYYTSLDYIENLHLREVLTRVSLRVLIYGAYYGIIQEKTKDSFVLFDLPTEYCRSIYKDIYGNDILEFKVTYFDSIVDEYLRETALKTYPKEIANHYRRYSKGKVSNPWCMVSADVGVCFTFFDDSLPILIPIIPDILKYDQAIDTDLERQLEEIKKIIVQKVPHLTDGQLLFEPEEAKVMHEGSVKMLSGNKNLSVLTTYTDVDAVVSKTSGENVANAIKQIFQNVYANAGVSSEIFAPTGSQAIPISIKNDLSLMMILGNKYAHFFTNILNSLFSNSNISFSFEILPVSYYNQDEYITTALKLASSGYSFLVPAVAAGLTQKQFTDIKDLENDVLQLANKMRPLTSSYTQSGEPGAPEKKLEDKSDKTIQNQQAIDNQGGE